MHALEVSRFRGPAAIAPHDLAREAALPEDLVAEHLQVVARLRIDVEDEAALGQQQIARDRDAVEEAREVLVQAVPAIVEGGDELALDAAVVGATPIDLGVLAPREEGRVEVDQRRARSALVERPESRQVVTHDEV